MANHGITFQKKFGQNFLTNPDIVERIADNAGENTLEIGPGIGTLTAALCERSKKVTALEIDSGLIGVLSETLSEYDNVKVINKDVMQADIPSLAKEEFSGESFSVCANLPYYITTPVIMRLLESGAPVDSITVMIQKEVAARLCAEPGSTDYGAITVAIRRFGKAQRLFTVSAGNFIPAPKVDSAVVRITPHKEKPYSVKSEEQMSKIIKAAFAQRRKTLLNSLSSAFPNIDKAEISAAIEKAGFAPSVRGEALDAADFAAISDNFPTA